jgi:uncharacterized protein (DUF488 family)
MTPKNPPLVVLTIGHSTHPIEEFIGLLQAHDVTGLADVRTIPRSAHNPQFDQDALRASLTATGINYRHWPELGGLRHAKRDSINTGWRNASFRGFADYMQTPEFQEAIGELIRWAEGERIALMCAEAVPWRCHRSLIGDALTVRGIQVEDIMTVKSRKLHTLTPFARVEGEHIVYDRESDELPFAPM